MPKLTTHTASMKARYRGTPSTTPSQAPASLASRPTTIATMTATTTAAASAATATSTRTSSGNRLRNVPARPSPRAANTPRPRSAIWQAAIDCTP